MRDKHDRSREIRHRVGQHVDGSRIEVIGRLIQQQGIGRFDEHASKGDAIPFAAAQCFDRFLLIRTGEEKGPGDAAEKIHLGLIGHFGQGFQNRMLGVQRVGLVLREVMER